MSAFDAPREYYIQQKTNDKIPLSELKSLRISYIEGVWTASEFKTIEQKEIIKIDVETKY